MTTKNLSTKVYWKKNSNSQLTIRSQFWDKEQTGSVMTINPIWMMALNLRAIRDKIMEKSYKSTKNSLYRSIRVLRS